MKWLILICLVVQNVCFADFMCKEEASERRGNRILACGIGKNKDESVARALALKNAKAEFNSICSASSDCIGKPITITPMRTACEKDTCYRMIGFEIGETPAEVKESGQSAIMDEWWSNWDKKYLKANSLHDFWDKWEKTYLKNP